MQSTASPAPPPGTPQKSMQQQAHPQAPGQGGGAMSGADLYQIEGLCDVVQGHRTAAASALGPGATRPEAERALAVFAVDSERVVQCQFILDHSASGAACVRFGRNWPSVSMIPLPPPPLHGKGRETEQGPGWPLERGLPYPTAPLGVLTRRLSGCWGLLRPAIPFANCAPLAGCAPLLLAHIVSSPRAKTAPVPRPTRPQPYPAPPPPHTHSTSRRRRWCAS